MTDAVENPKAAVSKKRTVRSLAKTFCFDRKELQELISATRAYIVPASTDTTVEGLADAEKALVRSEVSYMARINHKEDIPAAEVAAWNGHRAVIFAMLSAMGRFFFGQMLRFPEDDFIEDGDQLTIRPDSDMDFVFAAMKMAKPEIAPIDIFAGLGVFYRYVDTDAYFAGEEVLDA